MSPHPSCLLCNNLSGDTPELLLLVQDAAREAVLPVHGRCLRELLAHAEAAQPAEATGIPAAAGCGICGRALPVVGRHPWALTLCEPAPGRTWFVHAECVPATLRQWPAPINH